MNKIIFLVIGLPGSGKSTLLNQVKRGVVIDDIEDQNQLPPCESERIFISDPYFCQPDILERSKTTLQDKYPNHRILCIYFENSAQKALINDKKRAKKTAGFINQLSKSYCPPSKAIPIKT